MYKSAKLDKVLLGKDLHSNTSDDVSCVPKCELATVFATRGRVPRHDQAVYVYQNREDDSDVPRTEVWSSQTGFLPFIAHQVQADSHSKTKRLRRIDREINHEVESIASWRGQYHDHCQAPSDGVWANGSSERTS
jgi:hypothetical protein